jgi:hypothetical protein
MELNRARLVHMQIVSQRQHQHLCQNLVCFPIVFLQF